MQWSVFFFFFFPSSSLPVRCSPDWCLELGTHRQLLSRNEPRQGRKGEHVYSILEGVAEAAPGGLFCGGLFDWDFDTGVVSPVVRPPSTRTQHKKARDDARRARTEETPSGWCRKARIRGSACQCVNPESATRFRCNF